MLHTLASAPRAPSLKPYLEYAELESRSLRGECPSAVAPDGALLEYETLQLRVHPPNVEVDNEGHEGCTIVTVDSVNRPGTLVELVQCLTGLGLRIRQARISSDSGWFIDDFYVTDTDGGKVTDERKLGAIRKVLNVERAPLAEAVPDSAVLELAGEDCPGLLADIHLLLAQSGFDVQSAAVWTHKQKAGFAISISQAGKPVDYAKLETVRQILLTMLGGPGRGVALLHRVRGNVHLERKLHVLLLEEERKRFCNGAPGAQKPPPPSPRPVPGLGLRQPQRSPKHSYPEVTISAMPRLGYWVVKVVCGDRDKLLFDIACTLADMDYDVYHGSVDCDDGHTAFLEFYIRPRFQEVDWDEARVEILKYLLEVAIQRRFPRGLKVHVQPSGSRASLGPFMQSVKEGDLCITRAKVRRQVPGKAPEHTFYLMAADGSMASPSHVQATCSRLGGELALGNGAEGSSADGALGGAHGEERKFWYSFKDRQPNQEWEDNRSSSTASTASVSL